MIKSVSIRIAIVLIGIAAVFFGRGFFYYSGSYSPPPTEIPNYERVVVSAAPSAEFSDVFEKGKGIILIDLAHKNAFDKDELNVLMLRLISRGFTIEFLEVEDDLEKKLLGEELEKEGGEEEVKTGEEEELEEELLGVEEVEEEELEEGASAFIVVCPQKEFSNEEKKTVDKFVTKGGKLLLIADPTRSSEINSLSLRFGLIFEPGYLYNMKENEINYRNVLISEFKEIDLTKDLEKIALYTGGSISSADNGIAFIDRNTFSSAVESQQRLSPIALSQESKVLAIHDLTFITEPYNGILDNNRLIANIADWLTSPAKEEEKEEKEEEEKTGESSKAERPQSP